jgi:hypothetical protein
MSALPQCCSVTVMYQQVEADETGITAPHRGIGLHAAGFSQS